jgi:hypothetical protein
LIRKLNGFTIFEHRWIGQPPSAVEYKKRRRQHSAWS